ncbi:MAG: hypothetical protein L3J57_15705 [Desulfuromusa sp.]|nr:hypothetical protein [Desulfuromusa sp.]
MTNSKLGYSVVLFLILELFMVVLPVSAVELPQGTLDASQLSTLFSGKTVVADSTDGKKQKLVSYFGLDGQYQQVRKGWLKTGTWRVRKDGRLCIELEEKKQDCRIIVQRNNTFLRYAVKLDGNHKHELTYTRFRPGQRLAQMSNTPILPPGALRKKAVVTLFADKTVESVTTRQGRISQTYYHPDGKLEQLREGTKRYGTWRVKKNGRMCLRMEALQEKCRVIAKEGNQYKKYIIKKNGNHQNSVSYRKFSDGKTFE